MLRFTGRSAEGGITPPPSKSHTHRAFFLSALSDRKCAVSNALDSQDTRATVNAVRSIGAEVERSGDRMMFWNEGLHAPEGVVDADNSGTTMRIFAGIASMFDSPVTITGDASLRSRPMGPLLDALSRMNVKCSSNDGRAPVTICGPNRGGDVRIRGDISSQFISSLMMTAPMLPDDTVIHIDGRLSSRPYVDITEDMMGRFGADVAMDDGIRVKGGTGYRGCDINVPSDMSSAAFPLVAGALGGSVTVMNMDLKDPQGDKRIIDILRDAGADVTVDGDRVTASSSGGLDAIDVDMNDVPDLFPVVAVLLSTAKGRSRLHGAPQLRFKESDRIKATASMLSALGADVTETDDGCIIRGTERLKGGTIEHHEDHRVLMAAAVASLVCDGGVSMKESDCYNISYPSFIDDIRHLGLRAEVV